MKIYDFTVKDGKQNDISLGQYKGKVLLIINTATKCGFTPQYEEIEALYKKYHAQGLEVLDFPCNQFLGQAPGSDEEIASFCKLNYGTSFENFAKIEVNGKNAHPLYQYLKEQTVEQEDSEAASFKERLKKISQAVLGNDIKWNFTKFLVDREGHVAGRFAPTYRPADLAEKIEKLLQE